MSIRIIFNITCIIRAKKLFTRISSLQEDQIKGSFVRMCWTDGQSKRDVLSVRTCQEPLSMPSWDEEYLHAAQHPHKLNGTQ